jgi:hypothetical protein
MVVGRLDASDPRPMRSKHQQKVLGGSDPGLAQYVKVSVPLRAMSHACTVSGQPQRG